MGIKSKNSELAALLERIYQDHQTGLLDLVWSATGRRLRARMVDGGLVDLADIEDINSALFRDSSSAKSHVSVSFSHRSVAVSRGDRPALRALLDRPLRGNALMAAQSVSDTLVPRSTSDARTVARDDDGRQREVFADEDALFLVKVRSRQGPTCTRSAPVRADAAPKAGSGSVEPRLPTMVESGLPVPGPPPEPGVAGQMMRNIGLDLVSRARDERLSGHLVDAEASLTRALETVDMSIIRVRLADLKLRLATGSDDTRLAQARLLLDGLPGDGDGSLDAAELKLRLMALMAKKA